MGIISFSQVSDSQRYYQREQARSERFSNIPSGLDQPNDSGLPRLSFARIRPGRVKCVRGSEGECLSLGMDWEPGPACPAGAGQFRAEFGVLVKEKRRQAEQVTR